MSKNNLVLALILYVASAAISFGAMTALSSGVAGQSGDQVTVTSPVDDGESALGTLLQINPQEPKTAVCPLNGAYYTATEQAAWQKRRPLAVMIENTPDARPQSGLSDADIVFEAVAEGGITRFMAMYYCDVQVRDTLLAPIRSARTYFVDWASGFNLPLYTHVGGANVPGPTDALGQISEYGWNQQNDLNQFSIGYPTFYRDENRLEGRDVAVEHTMVTSTEKLWAVGAKRGWTNMSPARKIGRSTIPASDWKDGYKGWTFTDKESAGSGAITSIGYSFYGEYDSYNVLWTYDQASNSFKRAQGGENHIDLNNNEQVAAKNVVVLFATEKASINEKKHMLYGTIGTGKALLFKDGAVAEINWSKKTREGELQFTDAKGQPVALNRGVTWISVLATGAKVAY